jgi:hypothetical protein
MESEQTNFTDYVTDTSPAPEAGVEEAPVGDVNWEERYRSEVQDRIRERERYKPIRQVFDQMHPDDAAAVQGFAQAWASGDQDTAIQWMIENAKTLAGDKFYDIAGVNSRGQSQHEVFQEAIQDSQQANLTPEQVAQVVEERMAAFQHEQIVHQYEVEIEQTLQEAGYDPSSPLAIAAISAAQQREDLDLTAAIADIENQILQQAQSIVQRRQNPSAGMPSTAPNGMAPVMNSANMTPRDRAMARLGQQGL